MQFGCTKIYDVFCQAYSVFCEEHGQSATGSLEIDDGKELSEEFLQEELHPKINLHQPKFAKPKGPPGRGAKRLTKVQDMATSEQEL